MASSRRAFSGQPEFLARGCAGSVTVGHPHAGECNCHSTVLVEMHAQPTGLYCSVTSHILLRFSLDELDQSWTSNWSNQRVDCKQFGMLARAWCSADQTWLLDQGMRWIQTRKPTSQACSQPRQIASMCMNSTIWCRYRYGTVLHPCTCCQDPSMYSML